MISGLRVLAIALNVAAVGTAISFAKFIFLPHRAYSGREQAKSSQPLVPIGFWLAMVVLLGGLIIGNWGYLEAYHLESMAKALGTVGLGWLLYWGVISRLNLQLPRMLEQFEHLIGMMTLVLMGLFWMVLA
jgi:multicomponent Na+:H+ antiporter subunit D